VAITVRIPTQLRDATGGAGEVPAQGATVADVLSDVYDRFDGLRERIAGEDGELRRFVNVYVGGEDARTLQGLETPVDDSTTVILLPAMAGGRG
jgi:molybdopterin synthase sulfur carrier subunit